MINASQENISFWPSPPDARSVLLRNQSNRYRILKYAYEVKNSHPNNVFYRHQLIKEITSSQVMSEVEVELALDYLQNEGLIETFTFDGDMSITHLGLNEMEASLSNPQSSTDHFSAQTIQLIVQGNVASLELMNENKPQYDLRNARFGGGFAGRDQSGGTLINFSGSSEISPVAQEIRQLLDHLSAQYPTETSKGKMAVVTEVVDQIEKNSLLYGRVLNALKSGGSEALKGLINHPLANILVATFEGWQA